MFNYYTRRLSGADPVKFRAEVVDSCSSTVTGSRGIMQKIFSPSISNCSALPYGQLRIIPSSFKPISSFHTVLNCI